MIDRARGYANFRIGPALAAQINLTVGAAVSISRGDGPHRGLVAIQKGGERTLSQVSKTSRSLSVGVSLRMMGLGNAPPRFHPPHRIDGDMLVIDCRELLPAKQAAA